MDHEIQIMKLVCWCLLAPLSLCLHSADRYTLKLTISLTTVKNISSFLTLRGTVSPELWSKEKLCVVGAVERVKKIRDYAFVHFTHREDAINAMNTLNGKVSSWTLSSHRHKMDNRTSGMASTIMSGAIISPLSRWWMVLPSRWLWPSQWTRTVTSVTPEGLEDVEVLCYRPTTLPTLWDRYCSPHPQISNYSICRLQNKSTLRNLG